MIATSLLVILGIVMIYLGGFSGAKLLLPPVITGTGFFGLPGHLLRWATDECKKCIGLLSYTAKGGYP